MTHAYEGGGPVTTYHEEHRNTGLRSWSRTRWIVAGGVLLAVVVAVVLTVMLSGGGGGGHGGY
jgi:hypothetical protein